VRPVQTGPLEDELVHRDGGCPAPELTGSQERQTNGPAGRNRHEIERHRDDAEPSRADCSWLSVATGSLFASEWHHRFMC
jgi:hypothetical protein